MGGNEQPHCLCSMRQQSIMLKTDEGSSPETLRGAACWKGPGKVQRSSPADQSGPQFHPVPWTSGLELGPTKDDPVPEFSSTSCFNYWAEHSAWRRAA